MLLTGWMLVAAARPAAGHEQWIDVDVWSPAVPATVSVHICGGHHFPRSAVCIADKVIHRFDLVTSSGGTNGVVTEADGDRRTGTVTLDSDGVALLRLVLQRPRAHTPSYEATAIVAPNGAADRAAHYAVGSGFEIVPLSSLTSVRPGATLPLALLLDGRRIAGSIEVCAAGGKTDLLSVTVTAPAQVRLARAGRYLVTGYGDGRSGSLTFCIEDRRKSGNP